MTNLVNLEGVFQSYGVHPLENPWLGCRVLGSSIVILSTAQDVDAGGTHAVHVVDLWL